MMDVKELIIASCEAVKDMSFSDIWTGNPEGEKWNSAFKQIAEVRERILKLKENPRVSFALCSFFLMWCANLIVMLVICSWENLSILVGECLPIV